MAPFVGCFDQKGFQVGDGLGDAIVAAHGHILMLVAHDVIVADQRKLGDDLLPRHGAPAGDAEAEAAAQALPVALRDDARAAHVVRNHLAILGVHVVDLGSQGVDEVLDVDAQVDQVGGVEVETELLAPAHQFHRAQSGFHVVGQLVGVRFVGEFDTVLAEFIQDRAPAFDEFLLHIRPAFGIGPGEEASEVLAADETGDHGHFQGIGGLGGLDHALGAEFDLLFLGAGVNTIGILAIGTQDDLTFGVIRQG